MSTSADAAIVGIAVGLPDAPNLQALRKNLRTGRDSVREPAAERLRPCGLDEHAGYAPMAQLDQIDLFDHRFFNCSRREAELMDPHHRIALQSACAAIEDAGYRLSHFHDSRTAVLMAAPQPDYAALVAGSGTLGLLGGRGAALPARISQFLGLTGESTVVDTGCSSGLVALHNAVSALDSGRAEYALAGAVSLSINPRLRSEVEQYPEVMSAAGKCRAFDRDADGTSDGEGGVVLLLTSLERARQDGAHVYAVLRGSAVRHNGPHSAELATPSAGAQADVITEAWRNAGLKPVDADYVEAHGSGTRLGDAVEVEGLARARRGADKPLAVSSIKTNIGHLDQAAGLAGLVKTVLSVHHGELYPSLHFEAPPAGVNLDASGVQIVRRVRSWPSGRAPRRAGVSSFSLTGVNAHCVLEQAPAPEPTAEAPDGARVIGVSARTPTALARYCELIAAHLRRHKEPLPETARALNTGRDDYEHRVAVVAKDTAQLVGALADKAAEVDRGAVPGGRARCFLLMSGDAAAPSGDWRVHDSGRGVPETPAGERFRWQLGWYEALTGFGMRPDGVLSSGSGTCAARLVRGEAEFADAVADLSAHTRPADPERVGGLVEQLLTDGPAVFLELGSGGELAELVRERAAGRPDAVVLDLPAEAERTAAPKEVELGIVAELYERQVPIDWDEHHRAVDGAGRLRRIPLPTYPYDEEPCWPPLPQRRPAAEPAEPAAPAEATATGSTEDRVRQVWRHALGTDPPAAANYFAMGGNSITALEVLTRIEASCGVRLKMIDLYEHPTPAEIADLIDQRRGADVRRPADRIVPGSAPVLSFGQERFWFHHQMEPDSPLYNLPSLFHLQGPVDVDALRAALADFAARHEVLRSRFVTVDGEPTLEIDEKLPDPLRHRDLSGHDDPHAEANRLLGEEAVRPFDLAAGPLFRNLLLTLGTEDHLFCTNAHHGVDDGWSPEILDRELAELYAARRDGRSADLPVLPIQYRDYAAWQRSRLVGSALDGELGYWKDRLRGLRPLELPTDRPRPARKDYAGEIYPFSIPGEIVAGLRQVGQRENTTLFTVLLAATSILLARYSGQRDIAIGSATSGRNQPETRGILGFFNNVTALRIDLDDDPQFPDLLRRTRDTVLGALDHDEVPFDKVVEAIAPKRDLSRHPLFDVVFVHQTIPELGGDLGGTPMRLVESEDRTLLQNGIAPGTAKYDLSFCVWDRAGEHDSMPAGIEFSTSLFDEQTIAEMSGHWIRLLTEIVHDHRRTALRLPVSDAPAVLRGPEAAPVRESDSFPALLAEQVRQRPDAVAVEYGDGVELTYRELQGEVLRIAALLRDAGACHGDHVAVALPRSAELVAAALAIMHLGCAYVPLDPRNPADRLDFQLTDSQARLLLTRSSALTHRLAWQGSRIEVGAEPVDSEVERPPVPVAEDIAYVIYTSGSTGTPKGARLIHRGAVHVFRATARQWELEPGQRVLQFASATFDASVWEIGTTLAAGATLCVPPSELLLVGHELADYLVRRRIGVAVLPPSIIASLPDRPLPELALLVAGGEPLPSELVRRFAPGRRMLNAYGPTEATIMVTQGECDAQDARPTIGRPIPGIELHIRDEHGQPVPPGLPGELHIGGPTVGRGYLNRPELTEQAFTRDDDGAPIYRTGDLVRMRGAELEHLGRTDDQVKHRGYRIELGEIEAVLASADGVRQAVVVVSRGESGERLTAFTTGTADVEQLRATARRRLPAYMVPAAFSVEDALPLTSSGKVDRKELAQRPLPDGSAETTAAPADEVERTVAEVFQEVLATGPVGRDADFFELGGHSLLAVSLLRRIRARTGRQLALATLFGAPTVRELAEAVQDDQAPYRCLVPIRSHGCRPPLFCVHPAGGNVLAYQPFARAVDPEQPIYGLQSYGLGAGNEPDTTVTGMAERYVAEIREIAPDGPYHLAGWSFGGMIACEMARLLTESGAQVGMVVLLDTDITLQPPEHPEDDLELLVAAVRPWLDPGEAQRLGTLNRGAASEEALRAGQQVELLPQDMTTDELNRFLRVLRANDNAAAAWRRPVLQAPVTLLRCRDGDIGAEQVRALRDRVDGARPVAVRDVPGDHYTMMTTHAARIGAELAACLHGATANTGKD